MLVRKNNNRLTFKFSGKNRVITMASHFSDIGFKVTEENFENEIKNVIDSNNRFLSKITIGKEEYLILFLDN